MRKRLQELATLFLKLGVISFGGPAAHLALLEEAVVAQRQWLTHEQFLDFVGATNLIPGPNSTEMALHIGYLRAGYRGLVVAGSCFILPAALITAGCTWAYVRFGVIPQASALLAGVKPAILAIILAATWRLGRAAVKSTPLLLIGLTVLGVSALGVNDILVLLVGGVGGMCWLRASGRRWQTPLGLLLLACGSVLAWGTHHAGTAVTPATAALLTEPGTARSVALWPLGLFFLKIGSVLYGSGYVLIAFLEQGLVRGHGWLTQQQLLDAIAIGQFTPGPVLSTATCIGYMLAGAAGAVVATIAIFLPAFVLVAVLSPVVPRLRRSAWAAAFLDAVNVSAVALMGAVLLRLMPAFLTSWRAGLIALVAAAIGLRWRPNPAWLVVGGALLGWLLSV